MAKKSNKKEAKIEPQRWYSLVEMRDKQMFEWCKNLATYRRYVIADRNASNFLKAVIIGQGTQKRYRIKGENIIKYLVNVEDGTYQI